jgi:hypothetical protein
MTVRTQRLSLGGLFALVIGACLAVMPVGANATRKPSSDGGVPGSPSPSFEATSGLRASGRRMWH